MKRTITITALALLLGSGSLRAQEDRTPGIIRSALMGILCEYTEKLLLQFVLRRIF